MPKPGDQDCGCRETRRRWKAIRALLALAGLSLVAYMPYKAFTAYDRLADIYGPWFLQGTVVAVAGTLFAWRPGFAAGVPLVLRLAVAASALLWMGTGLACTPHLLKTLQTSLGPGLFAWFHMLAQHVFLALGVIAFAAVPDWLSRRLGATGAAEETAPATSYPA